MPPVNHASFRATHNSYSGDIQGQRGSIVDQLNSGVRCLELDISAAGFASVGDYQMGHDHPGDQVWHGGGNPPSVLFTDWIRQIAQWSGRHKGHAPIQLLLDTKDNFNEQPSAATGNHGALNTSLTHVFGNSLLLPKDMNGWPEPAALAGRIMTVLSGTQETRSSYGIDRGAHPSVAVNSLGQVVEVHASETGNNSLWYWIGLLQADGTVAWKRHGHYGTGTRPAVAVNDAGFVVEVHKLQDHDHLWYQIGKITAQNDISWGASHDYDNGILPTIQFTGSNTLREIHQSEAHLANWSWNVTLDEAAWMLSFSSNAKTQDPRWSSDRAGFISVQRTPDMTLVYSSHTVDRSPICYEQLAFIEYQISDPSWMSLGGRFAAAPADGSDDFLMQMRLAGYMTRGWQFKQSSPKFQPPECYAATDNPCEQWYIDYCSQIGVIA